MGTMHAHRGANLPAAWDITTGTNDVVVAVIDTGITNHADLAGQTVPGYDFINDALVAEWSALSGPTIRALAVDSAAAIDAHIATLTDERVAAAVEAGLVRNVDRSLHRCAHLDPIESLLDNG